MKPWPKTWPESAKPQQRATFDGIRKIRLDFANICPSCRALVRVGLEHRQPNSAKFGHTHTHMNNSVILGHTNFVRFLLNAWPTDARMHTPEHVRGCMLGCVRSPHELCDYIKCHRLWLFIHRALGIFDFPILGTARRVGRRYAQACCRHARLGGCLPHLNVGRGAGDVESACAGARVLATVLRPIVIMSNSGASMVPGTLAAIGRRTRGTQPPCRRRRIGTHIWSERL